MPAGRGDARVHIRVGVGAHAGALAVNPATDTIYVTEGGGSVLVIDGNPTTVTANTVIATFSPPELGAARRWGSDPGWVVSQ